MTQPLGSNKSQVNLVLEMVSPDSSTKMLMPLVKSVIKHDKWDKAEWLELKKTKLEAVHYSELILQTAKFGRSHLLPFLVERGGDLEVIDEEKRSCFHLAAENGHTQYLDALEKRGCSFWVFDSDWKTPFWYALSYGQENVVNWFLEKTEGAAFDTPNGPLNRHFSGRERIAWMSMLNAKTLRFGEYTPLRAAICGGNFSIFAELVARGYTHECTTDSGQSLLTYALNWAGRCTAEEKEQIWKMVYLLVIRRSSKEDFKETDIVHGNTPLHLAYQHGAPEALILMMIRGGADPKALNEDDQMPHELASPEEPSAKRRKLKEEDEGSESAPLEAFLKAPNLANLIALFKITHRQPQKNTITNSDLMEEIVLGNVDSLMERRSHNFNLPTSDGRFPLIEAIASRQNEVVTFLLDWGCDPYVRDRQKQAAIDVAKGEVAAQLEEYCKGKEHLAFGAKLRAAISGNGSYQTVKELLDMGAPIEQYGAQGENALHLAVLHSRNDLISLLIDAMPAEAINHGNTLGRTPLHLAVERNYWFGARQLVVGKADIDREDADGCFPWEIKKKVSLPLEQQPQVSQISATVDVGSKATIGYLETLH